MDGIGKSSASCFIRLKPHDPSEIVYESQVESQRLFNNASACLSDNVLSAWKAHAGPDTFIEIEVSICVSCVKNGERIGPPPHVVKPKKQSSISNESA